MIFESFENQALLVGGENESAIETIIVGGISARFQKESVDEPTKRFENLVVPIGLQYIKIEEVNECDDHPEDHSFIDEKQYSTLFYSLAKDLGSSRTKSKSSVTKKNRQ
jgi:hypothetical protein